VLPGPTRSEGMARFLEELARRSGKTVAEIEAEFIRTQRPTSLIRRLIEPEEVASPVLYAASPAASATTSASLRVDGGVVNSII
jgi:NAD(P)-dependent dehydrogenase (short-subunit alcohol dehydrogenase family)